jgi:homocysteine S-methyltransferase
VTTVVDAFADKGDRTLLAVDFSPPRSGGLGFVEDAAGLDADFICVAYAPGKSVRMDSATAAATIRWNTRKNVIFNLSPRDMNRLAIQSSLLGAQALDVENLLVLKGDPFSEKDLARLKDVSDFKPTELVASIASLNEGKDFKGLALKAPTHFCIGAAVDPNRELAAETALTRRKIEAGANFLITQAVYDPARVAELRSRYEALTGNPIPVPVLFGVQILVKDGLAFGDIPQGVLDDLDRGRSGADIAQDFLARMREAGCDAFYLIPPILKGGVRDYETAQAVIASVRG